MIISNKDSLNKTDLSKWLKNTFLFSIPALLALLGALQGGVDWKVALGFAGQALITSSIDLLRKYSAGVEGTNVPVIPSTVVDPINIVPSTQAPL